MTIHIKTELRTAIVCDHCGKIVRSERSFMHPSEAHRRTRHPYLEGWLSVATQAGLLLDPHELESLGQDGVRPDETAHFCPACALDVLEALRPFKPWHQPPDGGADDDDAIPF